MGTSETFAAACLDYHNAGTSCFLQMMGGISDVDLVRSSKDNARIICLHLKKDVTLQQGGHGLSEQDQIVPLLRGCRGTKEY